MTPPEVSVNASSSPFTRICLGVNVSPPSWETATKNRWTMSKETYTSSPWTARPTLSVAPPRPAFTAIGSLNVAFLPIQVRGEDGPVLFPLHLRVDLEGGGPSGGMWIQRSRTAPMPPAVRRALNHRGGIQTCVPPRDPAIVRPRDVDMA